MRKAVDLYRIAYNRLRMFVLTDDRQEGGFEDILVNVNGKSPVHIVRSGLISGNDIYNALG